VGDVILSARVRRFAPGLCLCLLPITGVPQAGQALTVTAQSRAVEPGELVLLTIVAPAPVGRMRVRAFETDLQPWRKNDVTWQVLVGIDLDVAPGAHGVAIEAGALRTTHDLTVRARTFPTRRLTVDPGFVDPPAAVRDRIAAEAARLTAIWRNRTPAPYWSSPFVRPVPHESNSAFGTRSVFNGQARSPHGGADFSSPAGTPVKAPNAGRVVLAGDLYYTGGTVVIDHGLGLISLVAHLSSVEVAEGDLVEAGAVVGKVGATGRVTGAHLHWTVRACGARVDPMSLLDVLGRT
jgi:murein DD-endopeptidase MepM/ murein hydrolase activator NlpD